MDTSEFREFVLLVGDMRNAQREYFRTRSHGALETSKRLERRVDERLKGMADDRRQGNLFGEEG
jgi:hypothetical protein